MEMNGGGFGEKEKVSGWGGGGGGGGGNRGDLSGREGSQKLARTDSYPFRVNSVSRSTENDPTFYNSSDFYDASKSAVAGAGAGAAAAAKTVQLFPAAFKSPGMASLRLPFTSAQWQELEQQALIYKYMVADVPIPPDLVIPIRKSLGNAAPISTSSHSNHGWGSFNLRFSGNLDPEPGRCRRTDGKKWRCSRDVAPDQKYCERHMHRSRPRSRKPVEVQLQNNPSSSNSSSITSSSSSTMCGLPSHLATKTFNPGDFYTKPSGTTDFKLPLQTLVPDKGCSRFLNWVEGGMADPMEANQQWQLLHSKLGATQQISSSSNNQQNDHQGCLFLNTNPRSLEPDSTYRQQQPPRVFIDAWSQMSGSSNNKSSESNELPISSLTLSMSHREDIDAIQMGLGVVNNSDRDSLSGDKPPQALNWMIPVSWQSAALGGPLAEVLQSSTTAATNSSPPKCFSDKSWCGGNGGGLNLMRDGWGEPSPRDSPRLVSSPTGVLQKTLVSLSDSSSGSSPTVAAKSDIAIQWLNQHN